MQNGQKFKLPASALVALSFFLLITVGTVLLCLPWATQSGEVNFLNALFTATSASCVTGLAITGTATHWSYFGQAVILLLIQVGGLGFITIMSLFLLYVKKHSTLAQRKLVMQSAGSVDLASVKGLVKIILAGTAIFESAGAFLLSFAFVPVYGWGNGIWQAIFTSVSAFCNAGFTLTDANGVVSLCKPFMGNPLVILAVTLLIIVGGIGFFVWGDVVHHGVYIKRYSFHSKVVLTVTGILITVSWALFMAFEWNNPATIGNEGVGTKILASLFMAVTPRTAGFASVDYAGMSSAGNTLTTVLMFVGGSPGSTAGGIKTTTLAVFVLSMVASARRREDINLFKRRFEADASHQASTIVCIYVLIAIASVMLISAVEGAAYTTDEVTFEVISAIATVGLSRGITASLMPFSKVVLVLLMFIGRVGGFTMMLVFASERKPVAISRVEDKVIIG